MNVTYDLKISLAAISIAVALLPSYSHAQALSTWVSAGGNDTNACTISSPCRTFQGAYSKTRDAGKITVLDAGEFGSVAIGKSITIDGSNGLGRIAPAEFQGSYGISISAPNAHVIIRGVEIQGRMCMETVDEGGGFGIQMNRGRQLHIENVSISHHTCYSSDTWKYSPYGISVSAEGSKTFISDSNIRLNGSYTTVLPQGWGAGIYVVAEGGTIAVNVTRTHVDGNYIGVSLLALSGGTVNFSADQTSISGNSNNGIVASSYPGKVVASLSEVTLSENGYMAVSAVNPNATIRLGRSRVVNNNIGLYALKGGIIQSLGDNEISGNRVDGSGRPVPRR